MSIFDHPDDVPTVATWRCPHCATLQPESTRCWACDQSPMTCATCRYFRRSVIGPVGFCGLDRARAILAGDEVRTCWQAPTDLIDLVSDRPGSGRTSWLTLAQRQRSDTAPDPTTGPVVGDAVLGATPMASGRPTPIPTRSAVPSREAAPLPASRSPVGPETPVADDLVEAPLVRPARRVTSEAQRRAQGRRDRQRSADDGQGTL